jgi:hypothetical protein
MQGSVAKTDNNLEQEWSDEPTQRSPFGHRLMFLLLACLSFVLFAPTAALPALKEYCDLLVEEARLQARVTELEGELKRRQELADAFAHDAIVNERLAMLDLHYQKPGEIVVPVGPLHPPAPEAQPAAAEALDQHKIVIPESWPAWTHDAHDWAEQHGLIKLFLDSTFRPIFLLMAGGLLIAAFVLYAPRNDRAARSAPQDSEPAPSPRAAVSPAPAHPEQ